METVLFFWHISSRDFPHLYIATFLMSYRSLRTKFVCGCNQKDPRSQSFFWLCVIDMSSGTINTCNTYYVSKHQALSSRMGTKHYYQRWAATIMIRSFATILETSCGEPLVAQWDKSSFITDLAQMPMSLLLLWIFITLNIYCSPFIDSCKSCP